MKKLLITLILLVPFIAHSQIIATSVGTGVAGYSGDGGPAISAKINLPIGCFVDASGNLYISDQQNHCIRKVNTSGTISTIAGTGTAGFSGDGGPATVAQLHTPGAVFVDGSGNVYFADGLNHRIRMVNTSGIISTIVGNGTPAFAGDGSPATAAEINNPIGVALDAAGNLYIGDQQNQRIRKVNSAGIISTIAGTGVSGYTGDSGPATAAQISYPNYVITDATGNIYFTDNGNHCVRKINTAGSITTIAGSGTAGYSGDLGLATAAKLRYPGGIRFDAGGNLYIADAFNYVVRKVNTAGIISTIAGTGTAGYSGDGGLATLAKLNQPSDIAIGNGMLYIADYNNSRMRVLDYAPHFINGHVQTMTVCENSIADAINSFLAVNDTDAGQTETWSTISGPSHGTAVVTYSTISTGGILLPTGLSYTPTAGYSGTDVIRVKVTDGITIDTTQINITVNPLPAAGTILGASTMCAGGTITLSDSLGGTWNSMNTTIATVGSSSGIVTGVSLGTVTIICISTNSCGSDTAFKTITVNPLPNAGTITGSLVVCQGGATNLTDATGTAGGTWSSVSGGIASVSSTGVVTGASAGTSTISYTVANSCGTVAATAVVTVTATPSPINGTHFVCLGLTTTLSDGVTGGTWSSSTPAVATVSSAGLVTGVSVGTTNITYAIGSCYVTIVFTVDPVPAPISGGSTVTVGGTLPLSDATAGGSWSSTNTAVGTVGSLSGIVTGISAGTTTIYYSLFTGCSAAIVVQVNGVSVDSIRGTPNVCVGLTRALNDSTAGGFWTSSNTSVAMIGSLTGIVSGVSAGTCLISYTVSSNTMIIVFTVNPNPVISGSASLCAGGTTTLTATPSGGTWSSGNPAIVTVGSSGVVTGLAAGTATITCVLSTGCLSTVVVTVNALPVITPTGPVSICLGGTASLTGTGGGTWSSSTPAVGTVSTTGVVTGISVGTTTISYTTTSACSATKVVTVNNGPTAITPHNPSVCAGSTVSLSDAVSGGTWLSTITGVATVSSTGLVTAVATGVTEIEYSIGSCIARDTVNVVAGPAPITPTGVTICLGGTASLSDATAGGTWSSSNTGVASVNTGGTVTGNAAGTAIITYTVGSCSVTTVVTVNTAPGAISPTSAAVCVGGTVSLSDATTGGVWSSSNGTVATVAGGVVTGISAGTVTISYIIGTCAATRVVTVNAGPAAITPGAVTICLGGTASLSDATAGGAWSSGATGIASVTTGGVVTGNAVGTAVISYTIGSCSATTVVTVNNAPGAINPTNPSVCAGSTVTLTDATSGGVWSSGSTGIATVSGGVVTGVSAGTATISYVIGTCAVTRVVTVNAGPSAISPTSVTICLGGTASLSDSTSGGIWSSSASGIASVTSGGVVTGTAVGTAIISYTIGSCSATRIVTVNNAPGAISPTNPSVCVGSTVTLTDATSGGVWSSGSTGIATVSGGVVTGIAAGTVTISYAIGSCATTRVVTVNPVPAAISGASTVGAGSTITLTDLIAGGTWSSSNTGVATAGAGTGIVTGVAAGTATITYTLAGGCFATHVVTVTALTGIGGTASVCAGSTTTLTDPTTGGTWSSSNTGVATVGLSTGVVTGVSAGTCIISYTIGTAITTIVFTVNAAPAPISGSSSLTAGTTITLTDAASGGTWTSSNTAVATVGVSTGLVTGVAPGTATITYAMPGGCFTTKVITVTSLTTIHGTGHVCAGSSVTLTDSTAGGHWSSSNTGIATVGSATGVVTGIAVGTCLISYTVGTSTTTFVFTVNANPSTISGLSSLIAGTTIMLSDAVSGGTWTSSNTGVATVGAATGQVTGVSAGTATITYTLTGGCMTTFVITVTPLTGISGTASVCVGSTRLLTDASAGGHWSSSNTGIATVGSSTGIVTGVAAGICTISYTLGTSVVTVSFTVNASPAAISGGSSVMVGFTMTLSDATAGGVWSTSNGTIAGVGSATGLVSAVGVGTATIYYTIPDGCQVSHAVTVNPLPTIGGTNNVCIGSTRTLTDSITGGHWSSSNTSIATVGSSTGVVTGVAAGTCIITYTVGTSFTTIAFTVNFAPPITGTTTMGVGGTVTLSDASPGGTWLSGYTPAATVGSATGVVTGVSNGTATIYYVTTAGCYASVVVTVSTPVHSIHGTTVICSGSTTTLSDSTSGGIWTSSNTAIATVGSTTGVVTGVSAGTARITYTVGASFTTLVVTVGSVPPITGTFTVAVAGHVTLSDIAPGGSWLSSLTPVATVVAGTGVVTGVSIGTATIYYAFTGGCYASVVVTVHAAPAPRSGDGVTTTVGAQVTIAATEETATDWTSGDNTIATVDANGTVTAIAAGNVNITHVVTDGEGNASEITTQVTVMPIPLEVRLVPNPNKGTFSIKSIAGIGKGDIVTIEITNMLGQVVYTNQVTATDGVLDEQVLLNSNLENGMYLLNVRNGSEQKTFHFVMEK